MKPGLRSLTTRPALSVQAIALSVARTALPVLAGEASPNGLWKNVDDVSGKPYRSKVRLTDDGRTLSVRGYIGAPMLGRSQTWVRQE